MKMFFRTNQPASVAPMILSQPVNLDTVPTTMIANQERKRVLQESILTLKYGMFSRIVNAPGCSNCGK